MSFDNKNIKMLTYQPEQPLDEPETTQESAPFIHDEQSALNELWAMLKTMRPAYSVEERRFIRKWIKPLGTKSDAAGNEILVIGDNPEVLWSCHTDTVHRRQGPQRIEQVGDLIRIASTEKRANCLGADCTTGVWLMRQMALARIPGLYIFHAAEEIGGVGSRHIANKTPKRLNGIKYAIAFDRRGTKDVITHQGWSRCASEAFAKSIAAQLFVGYQANDGGIFTDTANYVDIIPECSNLSVGYQSEHTKLETQSVNHALDLRLAMLKIDVSKFSCERNPAVREDKYDWDSSYYSKDYDWGKRNGYSSGKIGFGSSVGTTTYRPSKVINGPWEAEWRYGGEIWVKKNGEWSILNEEPENVSLPEIEDKLSFNGGKEVWIKRNGEWRAEKEDDAYLDWIVRQHDNAGHEEEEGDPLDWLPSSRFEE